MSNISRNQTDVVLGENTYTLRATFNCLSEISRSLSFIREKLVAFENEEGDISDLPQHIMAVLVSGIKGNGDKPNIEALEADIIATGIVPTAQRLLDFTIIAYYGGELYAKNVADIEDAEEDEDSKKKT